ncbi:hypothetical protein BDR26DRAFT_496910 [Obelidium mucronatum]|nr:hypothetical protein BDR26DRAFT_496910 [Obelidium mucronatum]
MKVEGSALFSVCIALQMRCLAFRISITPAVPELPRDRLNIWMAMNRQTPLQPWIWLKSKNTVALSGAMIRTILLFLRWTSLLLTLTVLFSPLSRLSSRPSTTTL